MDLAKFYRLAASYEQKLYEVYVILNIPENERDNWHKQFKAWEGSTPLEIFHALDICKSRALAGLSMPWEIKKQ